MKRLKSWLFYVFSFTLFFAIFWIIHMNFGFGKSTDTVEPLFRVGRIIVGNEPYSNGAMNVVTSIVLLYRGLDTLGELVVLLTATLAVTFVLHELRYIKANLGEVFYRSSKFLFPFALAMGIYVVLHGHLSPGGSFPGGAIGATGFLIAYFSGKRVREIYLHAAYSVAAFLYLVVGYIGLIVGGLFLSNFLGRGHLGSVFSGGIMPLLYFLVGTKVTAELTTILYRLLGTREE